MRLLQNLPRFRAARRCMEGCAARENWPDERIQTWQLDHVNLVWRDAVEHVPYYRSLSQQLGLPHTFSSLDEYLKLMPLLDKQTLRDQWGQLLSEKPQKGTWRYSGGSTGTPVGVLMSQEACQYILASHYYFYSKWNVEIFDRFLYCATTPEMS